MIETRALALLRRAFHLLQTDKQRVGTVERTLRASAMMVVAVFLYYPLLLRAKLGGPVAVEGVTEDGIRLQCRFPDTIQSYLYLFGTWEPDLTAFLRRRLSRGETVIDVGANVGYVSSLASKLVGPTGAVVGIEPSPELVASVEETAAKNGLTNLRMVNAAVSDSEGELTLFAGPAHNIGATTTIAQSGFEEQGKVRAAPLGLLVESEELAKARLIKIDVEGAEDRVLSGMVSSLDSLPHDVEIMVELTPQWWSDPNLRPLDVLRPFLDQGFHVYLLPNDYLGWRYLWPNDVEAPQRLRDMAVLEERGTQFDVVLSRVDADEL